MVARVEPVAAERGEVDPADERGLAVDDDELLVVAVHRPLVCVERERDARAVRERVADGGDAAPVGVEERQRRSRPRQHAYLDALRRARRAGRGACAGRPRAGGSRARRTSRRARPTRAPIRSRPRSPRALGTVDHHVDRVARARRRRRRGPATGGRGEHGLADAREPAAMVVGDEPLDQGAGAIVELRTLHAARYPACGGCLRARCRVRQPRRSAIPRPVERAPARG